MRTLLKITYVLPCFFIGLIIGGAAVGKSAAWISGLILLAADIVLGCILQFIAEKRPKIPVLLTERERRYLERVVQGIKKLPPQDDREFTESYETEDSLPDSNDLDSSATDRDDMYLIPPIEEEDPKTSLPRPGSGKLDEKAFAMLQQHSCGFFPDYSYTKSKYESLQQKKLALGMLTADEESKLIFPLIFGTFACPIDLTKAFTQTLLLLNQILIRKPTENLVRENELYMQWLHEYAVAEILLGTIYAYWNEPVKASYHFLLGLKTDCIGLNLPYCDFIRYTMSKLSEQKARPAKYRGCGFSAEAPMGFCGGTLLNTRSALQIIPEMEGEHGEVIVARQGTSGMFGYLQRVGSVFCKALNCPIDIYESYIIDKKYTLKKIQFFFNGYFSHSNLRIKIARGFHLKSHSEILNNIEIIA